MYIKPALPVGESKTKHKDIMVYTHCNVFDVRLGSTSSTTRLAVLNLFLHWFTFHQLCNSYYCIVQGGQEVTVHQPIHYHNLT